MTLKEAIQAQKDLIQVIRDADSPDTIRIKLVAVDAKAGLKVIEKELEYRMDKIKELDKKYIDFRNMF